MMQRIVRLVATGLYTGYSPFVPGTVGTLPALLLVLLLGPFPITLHAVGVVMFFLSVWSAGAAEQLFGHDSKKIVIDEWAGMFFAVALMPYSWPNYLIAFFAFRLFDVVKLPPARNFEKLPGGWGVTMDDVAAGIQANIITRIIIYALRSGF
jgi:phosphatidylglycerophosphatase A